MGRFAIKIGDKFMMYSTIVDDIIWKPCDEQTFINGIRKQAADSAEKEWRESLDKLKNDKKDLISDSFFETNDAKELSGRSLKYQIKKYLSKNAIPH